MLNSMPDQREQTKNFIRRTGPILPVHLARELNTEILFASAILSELTSRNELRLTSKAIGGSPLYYLPGQESRILEKLSPYIKGKEKEALDLLKERRVLMDNKLEPWQRIALRSLKDFANAINVSANEHTEVFWKYFLVANAEANPMISEILTKESTQKEEEKHQQEETAGATGELKQEVVEQEPKQEKEQDDKLIAELKQQILKELKKETPEKLENQKLLKKQEAPSGKFYSRIMEFFKNNEITATREIVVKKEKEFDFIAEIPSPLGALRYYIKAKDKKNITEPELSTVFAEGKLHQLPAILIANGVPNKKAQSLLSTKFSGKVIFKKI